MTTIVSQLKNHPVFSNLPEKVLQQIASSSIMMKYDAQQIIVNQGEIWPFLFLVDHGEINAVKESAEGRVLIATTLAPLFTTLSAQAGVVMEGGYTGLITAFTDGGNPIRYWFFHMFRGNWIALALIVPAAGLIFLTWRRYKVLTGGKR